MGQVFICTFIRYRQIYDIMRYNYTSKIANGTGVMGQLFK